MRVRLLSKAVSTEEDRYIQTSPLPTMYFQDAMFRLPVPHLDKTLERYLAALEPVATSEEAFLTTKGVAEDIMTKKMLNSMSLLEGFVGGRSAGLLGRLGVGLIFCKYFRPHEGHFFIDLTKPPCVVLSLSLSFLLFPQYLM